MARFRAFELPEALVEERAAQAFDRVVRAGAVTYRRSVHLPRLIPVMPSELSDSRPEMRRVLLRRLARALRAERNRGRAGHWTYDLNRHIGLAQAYAAERAALRGR
jgi:hypothetical protein